MNRLLSRLLLAAFLLAAASVRAGDLPAPMTDDLLQKSGLINQLAEIEPALEAQLNLDPQIGGTVPEARLAGIREAYRKAYATERLTGVAKEQLARRLPADVAKPALDWLGSPLGQRITRLEDEAGRAAGFEERSAAAEERFKRLPQRRIERYTRLAKATLAGEGSATVAIDLTLATARGLAALDNEPAESRIEALRKQLQADRASMVQSMEQRFVVLFSGAYETLEDRELDDYIGFAESPAGAVYHRRIIEVIDAVMDDASREAGRLIAAAPAAAPSGR